MSAAIKIQPRLTQLELANPYETLLDTWNEYKDRFGVNHIVGAAVEVTRHRQESRRKHITFEQAEAVANFSLYGENDKGHSIYDNISNMTDRAHAAMQMARSPEDRTHFENKWHLLRKIVACLETIYPD